MIDSYFILLTEVVEFCILMICNKFDVNMKCDTFSHYMKVNTSVYLQIFVIHIKNERIFLC